MMEPTESTPPARTRFDSLLSDPRHYRGDLRMVRAALRANRLESLTDDERAALVDRVFNTDLDALAGPCGHTLTSVRALLTRARLGIDMTRRNQLAHWQPLGYMLPGRPRRHRLTLNKAGRIDANELRRRAKADGTDLRTLHAIDVRPADKPDDAGERIALAVVADARYGWRVWLVCPRCKCRRAHLYPVRAGVRCRKCAGIAYADGE